MNSFWSPTRSTEGSYDTDISFALSRWNGLSPKPSCRTQVNQVKLQEPFRSLWLDIGWSSLPGSQSQLPHLLLYLTTLSPQSTDHFLNKRAGNDSA